MTNTAATFDADAWQRLGRVTGVAGLAAVILILVPIVVGTRPEPAFTATATEFLTYYRSPHTPAAPFRSFVFTVGLVTFVWFVGALTTLLRRAEGEAPWRSAIAMGSGVLFVAMVLSGNEVAAAFRSDDLDPQIARFAFDEGQAAFANARVALGSFAGCCGWVIASTRFLPRWLGWLAIASGVGLALSRISWTSYIWLLRGGARVTLRWCPDWLGVTLAGVILNLGGEVGDQLESLCQVVAPDGMVMERLWNTREPWQRTWVGRPERGRGVLYVRPRTQWALFGESSSRIELGLGC
jgi:hypothetical protein